jgi:hypothetical protein
MKQVRILAILAMALGLVAYSAQVGYAEAVGARCTYQGRLIDGGGLADGSYDLTFSLWTDPCEVNEIYRIGGDVNLADWDVVEGYFTVELDFNDVNAFNGGRRWLEIGVRPGDMNDPNAYTYLSPRQELTATPYAQYAMAAEAVSMPISISGSGTVPVIAGTSTGDGMALYGVHSVGGNEGYIGGSDYGVYGTNTASGNVGSLGSDSYGVYGQSASGYAGYFAGDSAVTGDLIVEGNVGIGTSSPAEALDVQGTVKATAFVGDGNGLTGIAPDSDWTAADGNVYRETGKVGIGTSTPAGKLDVWAWSCANPASGLDQQNTLDGTGAYGGTSNWQSFTPSISGLLTQVDIKVRTPHCMPPSSPADMTVTIRSGEGTYGEALASRTVSVSATSSQWYGYGFSTPAWLDAGNKYTIHVTTEAGDCYWWGYSSANPYPGGMSNGATHVDATFKTYMKEYTYGSALKVDPYSGNVDIGIAKILSWNSQQVSTNGYTWVGNILFQWGSQTSTVDGSQYFNYPMAFPNECFSVSTTLPGLVSVYGSGFYLDRQDGYSGSIGFKYMAIGH